jgi:nitrite reductase (cytochrome c-552)
MDRAFVGWPPLLLVAALAACGEAAKPGPAAPDGGSRDAPVADLSLVEPTCATCHPRESAGVKSGKHLAMLGQCESCHAGAKQHQADPSKARASVDFSIELCGECHADAKAAYLKDDGAKAGKYGGSIKSSKYDEFPKYKRLMGGHGFTVEYNEERAHAYMLKDHLEIKRKQNVVCLQCKSTPVAYYWGEQRRGKPMFGKDLAWADAVQKIKDGWPQTVDYGASCGHCHDPHSTGFRLVRKAVVAAILERGTDPYGGALNYVPKTSADLWAKMNERDVSGRLTTNARRLAGTLTCAQCHIEYTCGPGADKEVLRDDVPWRKLRDIEAYYQVKYGLVQDWKHGATGLLGIKPQHPETETFWEGPHYKAGASCADCHLLGGGGKSNHWFSSPAKRIDEVCGKCHAKSAALGAIQDSVMAQGKQVEIALDALLTKIEAAAQSPGFDQAKLAAAKERFMRALTWWEWTVVSENSAGFHNPSEAEASLKKAAAEVQSGLGDLGL